jgi:hypothetical protein
MTADILRHHLQRYGASIGIPDIGLNEHNVCTLRFDNRTWIHISYNASDEELNLTSNLSAVASLDPGAVYEVLLAANADWDATAAGCLALDPLTRIVLYRYREPIRGVDYQRFQALLERFINRAEYWKARLERIAAPAEAAAPAATAAGDETVNLIRI